MSSRSEQTEFSPINPLDLSEDERADFYKRIRRLADGPEEFIGSQDVIRLTSERVLGVGVTIRFHHSGLPEFQIVTPFGLLPTNYGNDPETLRRMLINPPFSVLDTNPMAKGKPYRWGVYNFKFISNKEIENILEIDLQKP
jgi:hypothetical protein